MKAKYFRVFAGKEARLKIDSEGFVPEIFSSFMAASGGPKVFSLYGLDRFFFGEFFSEQQTDMNLLGSSAGAFRVACLAQKKPIEALERFVTRYIETTYSKRPTAKEVSTKIERLLEHLFGQYGQSEVLENESRRAHFFVTKVNGLAASELKVLQGLGLLGSVVANFIGRRHLKHQYARYVFHSPKSTISINHEDGIPTRYVSFDKQNLIPSLLASGSLPLTMLGVENITNATRGTYRDGGLVDYHFDLDIQCSGVTLYPHFCSRPLASWFDNYSLRSVNRKNYSNVVLVCPSKEFIDRLPYKKIPDKGDFFKMNDADRVMYWNCVLEESMNLAEEFSNCLESGDLENQIQKLNF